MRILTTMIARSVVTLAIMAVCVMVCPVWLHAKTIAHLGAVDKAVCDSLDRPSADTAGCYQVRPGRVWSTAVGSFTFENGTLVFLQTVGGAPTGCYFIGMGRVRLEPPTAIERGQLRRFCDDSILETSFAELFVRYFDAATQRELRALCAERSTGQPPRDGILRRWDKRINDDLVTDMGTIGWLSLREENPTHAALVITGKFAGQGRLYFTVDDEREESVGLLRHADEEFGKGVWDLICSYDRPRTPDESERQSELLYGGVDILSYDSDVTIKQSTQMLIDTRLGVRSRAQGLGSLRLSMAPKLEIDSAWVNGDTAHFIYDDANGSFIATCADSLEEGDTASVRIQYRGKHLLSRMEWGDFFIHQAIQWLPMARPRARAHYRTTFRFPKHYDLVSCGELVSDTIAAGWRIKRWRTYNSSAYISFNYGSFDYLSLPMMDGPRLDIYRSENHPRGLFAGNIKKAVAADIEGAVSLFSHYFTPYPWPSLAATEIPGLHGQGFPQLLHLAWYSFETSKQGITDAFRAHEVAHQWFGHLVGWKTYHDQWLSEGFAEYAGAMYVQARNAGTRAFEDLLERWRSDILKVGGHLVWHAGPREAPIWLGWRCGSASSPGSYGNLVYAKGAYVLHMLRYMMYDYEKQSDERFAAMMRDYVSSHAFGEASTEDFQHVVERHLGRPMQWFFDQWVYGVQIPRYEYSWNREQTEDGQWIIRGSIEQHEVDTTFRVVMPITLVFGESRQTILQEVSGSKTSFTTAPLDLRPNEVRFNDFYTVLCRERVIAKP